MLKFLIGSIIFGCSVACAEAGVLAAHVPVPVPAMRKTDLAGLRAHTNLPPVYGKMSYIPPPYANVAPYKRFVLAAVAAAAPLKKYRFTTLRFAKEYAAATIAAAARVAKPQHYAAYGTVTTYATRPRTNNHQHAAHADPALPFLPLW